LPLITIRVDMAMGKAQDTDIDAHKLSPNQVDGRW
jgi:hypothetical protein